jgi:hypothetical protein
MSVFSNKSLPLSVDLLDNTNIPCTLSGKDLLDNTDIPYTEWQRFVREYGHTLSGKDLLDNTDIPLSVFSNKSFSLSVPYVRIV